MFSNTLRSCRCSGLINSVLKNNGVKKYVPTSYFCTKTDHKFDYKPIYKYPYISIGAALNKIKKLQVAASAIVVPGSLVTSALSPSICSLDTAISISTIGVVSTVTVCLFGQIFNNMIGFVYTTPDLQTVRFSYLDFWGTRRNIDFPREELMPVKNSASYISDFLFTRVYRYSSDTSHKLSLKSGEILNTEAFRYIFGHCPD